MKWKIVTDTGSNIRELENLPAEIGFEIVPLVITLDGEQFVDDRNLDTEVLMEKMKQAEDTSTACPAPGVYAEKFQGVENVICFTLSNGISGSYNSAELGRAIALEENPDANIHIFDSKTAGGEMDLLILKTVEIIQAKNSFEEVVAAINDYHEHTYVGYMLQSVDNLVKNGRVNKVVGSLVGLLNINVIGVRSKNGRIEMADRVRGENRAIERFIKNMTDHGLNGQRIEIGHVNNRPLADKIAEKLSEQFPQATINIRPTSGLCSFYAEENGLIVGYEKD